MDTLQEKWYKDTPKFNRITNNDLMCATCKHRKDDSIILGNTSKCKKYKTKPNNVLNGNVCPLYEEE